MDLSSPLPSSALLSSDKGSRPQLIVYKGLNVKCFSCGFLGHLRMACPKISHLEVNFPSYRSVDMQLASTRPSVPSPPLSNALAGVPEGHASSCLAFAGSSLNLIPRSLLKETEEVHRDSGALATLIKKGMV
ncbi:hypothetical protein KI387_016437, partial [Taxus chinensis]